MSKAKVPMIGEQLRSAIAACGLSANELSRKTGVAVPVITRFMLGERGMTLANAERICAALRIGFNLKEIPRWISGTYPTAELNPTAALLFTSATRALRFVEQVTRTTQAEWNPGRLVNSDLRRHLEEFKGAGASLAVINYDGTSSMIDAFAIDDVIAALSNSDNSEDVRIASSFVHEIIPA